jgi:hypothetical protein
VVYRELLRDDFEKLPALLRRLHSAGGARARGVASVRHHNRWLAGLIGFPSAGENIRVDLEVTADGDRETWVRRFGARVVRSQQRCEGGLLVEDMGHVRLRLRAEAGESGLRLESETARFWGLPLPVRVHAAERPEGSGWRFEVEVSGVGWYSGAMELLP